MFLALAGWMSGYTGGFPFDKPGDLYGEEKYVGMRIVSSCSLTILKQHLKNETSKHIFNEINLRC